MKENKINLILGSHAHVPAGASESEFEYVYENKMRPFVSNLYRYSKIQAVLHYSGVLLNWVERNHPEFLMLIEDMVSRRQAEIIGGGFYEPCFPLVSPQDRISQIEFMTTYLRRHFGKRPQGCWIQGMIWEQNLVYSLCASDMSYTFLSQEQFVKAGIEDTQFFSPCITEDQGKLIVVFPVSLAIGKELEKKSFSQVFIELKKKFASDVSSQKLNEASFPDNKIVCVFPDKISLSAKEAGDTAWNRFFEEISLLEDTVETVLPVKIFKTRKFYKKLCFPDSSDISFNESPRKYLIDNAEANSIYSKMMFVNTLINQLKGDKNRKLNAREELWKAQDACFFSQRQYRSELRKAAYSSLIRAEKLSRDKGKFIPSLIQYDFDFDGIKEFLFQDAIINYYVQLKGACIFELDYLPKDWNYLDCGLSGSSRRTSFSDILLSSGALEEVNNIDDVFNSEKSRFCYNEFYEAITQDRKGKSCFRLPAGNNNVPLGNIEINKCFLLKKDVLSVSYSLRNTGSADAQFIFIPQIIFSFAGLSNEHVRFYTSDDNGKDIAFEKAIDTNNIKVLDLKNEVQILISAGIFFSCRISPLFDNGFYQAARIMPVFNLSLKNGETWSNEFLLKFSH